MKPQALLLTAFLSFGFTALPARAETPAEAAQPQVIETLYVAGVIEVDASGQVEQITLRRSNLRQEIEQNVLAVMRGWTFEPYLVEGTARRIRTSVMAQIDQLKSEAGYQLVLGDVEFGQPLAQKVTSPRYPGGSLKDGISAEVLLKLTLDESGGVALAEPVTARVLNKAVRDDRRHRRLLAPFVRASMAAVQDWRFDFVERRADGDRHEMLVPIAFTIGRRHPLAVGKQPPSPPVLFELSTPLGRPLDALARELEGRSDGVLISPVSSPLKLRAQKQADATM